MWDKQSSIALLVALSTLPALSSCEKNQPRTPPPTTVVNQNAEYTVLQQRFQHAHTIKGREGLEARADAYEALGAYELSQCERRQATTGILDQELYDDALNCYRQSTHIAGERSSTLTGIARANYITREYFEAGLHARRALEIDENNVTARVLKICSFIARNRTEHALPDIEWYLSHAAGNDPEDEHNQELRELAVTTYLSRGNRAKAKEHAILLFEEHPESTLNRTILHLRTEETTTETQDAEK